MYKITGGEKRRNPSLSAWNLDRTLNSLFHLFLSLCLHYTSLYTDIVSMFLLFFHWSCLFSALHFFFMCTKIQSGISSITEKKIPDWSTFLIEKSGKGEKKKISPASPVRLPVQLFCLPESLLLPDYARPRHTATSINVSCYAAALYTPPCLTRVTLPRPVSTNCVHQGCL